ncbi:uncharacterized protein LOC62_01G000433 [Vanrija pseudolonga]|uniref:DUF7923 domain-containing protein n=1 Tax=Vanrija pseudolonga TaxID=143232 RepID=A0AAF0Y0D4_9TREE|nr:hypothetical protein LOC62_01G000433 [Vanrija pseudolonga]
MEATELPALPPSRPSSRARSPAAEDSSLRTAPPVSPPTPPTPVPATPPSNNHILTSSVDELQQLFARQLVGPSREMPGSPVLRRGPSPTIADVDVDGDDDEGAENAKKAPVVRLPPVEENSDTVAPVELAPLITTAEEGEEDGQDELAALVAECAAAQHAEVTDPASPVADDTATTPADLIVVAATERARTPSPAPTITSLMARAGLSPSSSGTSTPAALGTTLERLVSIEPLWLEFKSAFYRFENDLGGIASGVHKEIESHKCASGPPKEEETTARAASAELTAKVEQLELENYELQVCERKALEESAESKRLLEVFRTQLENVSKELQEVHGKCDQANKDLEEERSRHEAERKLREAMEKAKVESVADHARLNLKTVELGKRYVVLEHDLEMAHKENKSLQAQLGEATATAFVLVLVEAEARMFDPQLLRQGYYGGAQYADALKAGAEKLYSMMNPGECPRVVIVIYFDAATVADQLKEVGWVKNDNQIDDFLEGLSSWDLTTLSDVSGSFGASTKIKAQLGMLGSLYQCQMIVLVAGQDRKYIAKLDELGPDIKNKVTAIRSTPLGEAKNDPFRSLGDDRLYHMPTVFATSQAEWDSIRYRPAPRPAAPRSPTNTIYHNPQQTPQRHEEYSTPRPPSNQRMAQPTPANNYGYEPQPTPIPQHRSHQSQEYAPHHSADPRHDPRHDPHHDPRRERAQHGHDRSDTYYSRAYDGNDYDGNGHGYSTPSGYQPQRTPQPEPDRYQQRSPQPPRAEATSRPPWQEYRAFSQAVDSTRAQAQQHQQQSVNRPRSPHIIHRRPGSSMGGSPASSDERNPPLPHIPAAARTHVVRPPTWAAAGQDIARPQTSNSLISTMTGQGMGGGPPPNWRVNLTTYNQGYNHQVHYPSAQTQQGQGQQGAGGQYERYQRSNSSDERVKQWRASSDYSRS